MNETESPFEHLYDDPIFADPDMLRILKMYDDQYRYDAKYVTDKKVTEMLRSINEGEE